MSKIIVNTDKAKSRIAPEIYGQFAEHLGHCIYEGVFVGEDSPIPNVRGIRSDVVAALKQIKVPVIRWPGGCFADEYHWRDGIGPRDQRPSMVNSNWGGVVEDNSFGTHEFLDLCEQVGAEPYINGNVGSGEVREMQEWIEYITCADMNSPMARLRAENGHPEPWKLKWFGVGNENWGCGGNMCPDYYAQLYKRYQTFVRNYGDNKVAKIACGPNVNDYDWMERVFKGVHRLTDYITLHHYAFDGQWEDKGEATVFGDEGWYHLLHNGYRMEELIKGHLAIMDRVEPAKRVKLIVDEWGSWHKVEPDTHPGFLFQQNTLRDALLASLTFDIFNAHADRVAMANIAQMINVLQAMILTDGERMILTPTYHVFDLYKGHQGAELLDAWHTAADVDTQIVDRQGVTRDIHFPGLSLTASRNDAAKITLTVSNLKPHDDEDLEIELFAAAATEWKVESATILRSPEGTLNTHNTFAAPETVAPAAWTEWSQAKDGLLQVKLPAAALLRLELSGT